MNRAEKQRIAAYFVSIIVAIVVIVLIIYRLSFLSEPKYNLIFGAAFFVLGSIFMPLGWHILQADRSVNKAMRQLFYEGKYKTYQKWLCFILFSLILGPLMIAGGGMFSTRGWNGLALKSQLESQKTNLIKAVFYEWAVNNVLLNRSPLVGTVFEKKNDQILGIYNFSVFNTIACESFLASGLLTISKSDDGILFETILNYQQFIQETNELFKNFNNEINGEDIINKKIDKIEKYQKDIWKSQPFLQLYKYHQELGGLLKKRYPTIYKELLSLRSKDGQHKQEILNNGSTVEPANVQKE